MITDFRAVLRTHGIPDAGVSPSRLKLATHYEYSRGHDERRHAGYKCQADFEIETEAIASLQQLLIEVVDAGGDWIDGIEFDVRAKPALRPRARRDAVAATRAKAELFTRKRPGSRWAECCISKTLIPNAGRGRPSRGVGGLLEMRWRIAWCRRRWPTPPSTPPRPAYSYGCRTAREP